MEKQETKIIPVSHELLSSHSCPATVVMCMDFRFVKATQEFVQKNLATPNFDLLIAPGCIKGLLQEGTLKNYLLENIALSIKLHLTHELVLVCHSTCGAYGIPDRAQEHEQQEKDLAEAAKILTESFPSLSIHACIANGDAEKEEIVYENI
ncbi:MAG: hypothetical protein HYV65_02725 [Candidatus Spechtbacteria bacterium]|nr:hypothetical protein [Candidatus Spechtbacteria bacterium]